MQVSCDGAVTYVMCQNFNGKEGKKLCAVNVASEGNIIRIFANDRVSIKCEGHQTGEKCSLVLRVYQGRSGAGISCEDIIF